MVRPKTDWRERGYTTSFYMHHETITALDLICKHFSESSRSKMLERLIANVFVQIKATDQFNNLVDENIGRN